MAKQHYRRSTPPIRLRRHVEKLLMHSRLVVERLEVWKSSGSSLVEAAADEVRKVLAASRSLDEYVGALVDSGFVPPLRVAAWRPEPGQHVRVADKHRGKYSEMFERVIEADPGMLDDLVVDKILPTGEVVVQRGRRTPFAVRKSHLQLLEAA
jgi:hypothetical protein